MISIATPSLRGQPLLTHYEKPSCNTANFSSPSFFSKFLARSVTLRATIVLMSRPLRTIFTIALSGRPGPSTKR
eukprot:987239-Prorocentrum_lima.AAC.1